MNEKRSVSTYKWKRRYVSRSEKCSVYGVDHELIDQCIRPTYQYSEEVCGKNQDEINQKKPGYDRIHTRGSPPFRSAGTSTSKRLL